MVGFAQKSCKLIHYARREADGLVLRSLPDEAQLDTGKVEAREFRYRRGDGALERRRGSEPCAGRDVSVNDQIDTCDGAVTLQCSRNAERIRKPSVRRVTGSRIVEEPRPLIRRGLQRVCVYATIGTASGRDEYALFDREGKNEPFVVIGVLADEVGTPRRRPDGVWLATMASLEGLMDVSLSLDDDPSVTYRCDARRESRPPTQDRRSAARAGRRPLRAGLLHGSACAG